MGSETGAKPDGDRATADPPIEMDPEIAAAAAEVDRTLIAWARSLTLRERLDACTRATRALERLRHASPEAS